MKNQPSKKSNGVDNSLPSYKIKSLPTSCVSNLKSFQLPFRFNAFFQPGIYAIVNTQTNKYYIDEANISIISNPANSIPIKVDDQIFNNISQASSHFGVSLATIRA